MRLMLSLFVLMIPLIVPGQDANLLMQWGFEKIENRKLMDASGSIADTIEGNFEPAPGVSGHGLRFDGFTTCVKRSSKDKTPTTDEFTVEAWIALGNFPWNWDANGAVILVDGKEWRDGRAGIQQELHGTDLIVFLRMQRDSPVMVSIKPE